jgi:hypothetical protein
LISAQFNVKKKKGVDEKNWVIRFYVKPTSGGRLANNSAHVVFRAQYTWFF